MQTIAIIGGGFSGTMVAVHLIDNSHQPTRIVIINEAETFNKGIAFNPYSKHHLLNVPAAKMSAFPDKPAHFLDWVCSRAEFSNRDRNVIGSAFLPRYLYGEYLTEVWQEAARQVRQKNIVVEVKNTTVEDLHIVDDTVTLTLANGEKVTAAQCVISTGNHVPRNPRILNRDFFNSPRYFQNPWNVDCVRNADKNLPVLIVGNGLTMVDTVLGLLEHNFGNEIFSVSPNGFNILPHRHGALTYPHLANELHDDMRLHEVVSLFRKHMRLIREFGLSAEPLIDSLRPHTQRIWQGLTHREKDIFMSRLRHFWGVARHRIPLHIHDKIQQLQIERRLHIRAGQLIEMIEVPNGVAVSFLNSKSGQIENVNVSRVINCTGPETDVMQLENSFLKNCWLRGTLTQDHLKLGINADPASYQVIDKSGARNQRLYTIGSNLKGILWESTAVNEIRQQASALAKQLVTSPAPEAVV